MSMTLNISPATYLGVPVPAGLIQIWDTPEAEWWRRGVTLALCHVEARMESLTDGLFTEPAEVSHV